MNVRVAAPPLLGLQGKLFTHLLDSFFDLADTIITVRNLICRFWATHR